MDNKLMESFLSLFVFHDSYVVAFLVLAITIVIVMLLLFNSKTPESVVKSGVANTDNIEGALRRVLGEQRRLQGSSGTGDPDKLSALEEEVLQKDKTIADLNKQLTQSGGGDGSGGDSDELVAKIAELESRLQEYEIIEDDIADLSLYRDENEKLKQELERLKNLRDAAEPESTEENDSSPQEVVSEESAEPAVEVASEPKPQGGEITQAPEKDMAQTGTDLVAEFEKVVNNQDQLVEENPASTQVVAEDESSGKVLMSDEISQEGEVSVKGEEAVHPKLQNINPDSKEEADVFVSELKSLKKVSK